MLASGRNRKWLPVVGAPDMPDPGNSPERSIAVVVVSYRTAKLTISCLGSVERERHIPGVKVKAVVVDNASGDATEIQAAVDKNGWGAWVTVVASNLNGGFAYGNNVGMRQHRLAGTPDYYYLLNPDTELRPGAISELVNFLDRHPEVGIAGGSFENTDGTDWPISFRYPGLVSQMLEGLGSGLVTAMFRDKVVARVMPKENQPVDWICGASMMVRREVVEATGGLDEEFFLYFEETDFCRRARESGFATWYIPSSRVLHHSGQSTQLTGAAAGKRRMPQYWFASRRRYFAVAFGVRMAMAIDAVAITSYCLGHVKRFVLGRLGAVEPHFVRDLVANSIIWPKNRRIAPAKTTAMQRPT